MPVASTCKTIRVVGVVSILHLLLISLTSKQLKLISGPGQYPRSLGDLMLYSD